jgi:hypothetical protein
MHIRLFLAACLTSAILASTGAAARPITSRAATFDPQVSIWISDDTPSGHPDVTTTIDIATGPIIAGTETLSPPGGSIHAKGDIPDGWTVGWIGGFVTIPGADGVCNQRYTFNDVALVTADADSATFPPFLRALAPGIHAARYTADVAGTPVNILIDEVAVGGVQRLRTTSYVGDPASPLPTCAPFRSRVIMLGHVQVIPPMPPVGTAPPTGSPRVSDFTFTSRPDANGNVITVHKSVTATVQPGLRPRLEPDRLVWDAVPGAVSYSVTGDSTYTTTCALIRRLDIREEDRSFGQPPTAEATSLTLPASPGPDYELARTWADVTARDADGITLARGHVYHERDFASCWYPPGEEPLLHVTPEAGSCIGDVTFAGERFPTGVNVEITMANGPRIAVAPVTADGTFSVAAKLPESACLNASMSPGGKMFFYAYNADEPKGMTSFAGVSYAASLPSGWTPPPIIGPVTGTGSERPCAPWQAALALAFAGLTTLAAGTALRRTFRP